MARPKKEQPNHGKYYEVKATVGKRLDGTPERKSFYSAVSKEDAKAQATKYKIEREVAERTQQPFVTKEMTFKDYSQRWLKVYVKGSIKDSSYSSTYEIPLRLHLVPEFGAKLMTEIVTSDIQTFLNKEAELRNIDTVRKYYSCLKKIFEAAVEDEICWKSPVTKRVKVKGGKKSEEKRFYNFKQYDLVLEYAKTHPYGLSILIMLICGISRSELLGLKWEDVTPDLVMHIRRGVTIQKNSTTGKTEVKSSDELKNDYRERKIPIPQWLCDFISKQPHEVNLGGSVRNKTPIKVIETEYIIHGATGRMQNPANWSRYVFGTFMGDMEAHYKAKDIEIPKLNPHELRHTAATLWGLGGIDVYTIAKLGGWSDLKMLSKVYGHADVEAMRNTLGYAKQDKEDKA